MNISRLSKFLAGRLRLVTWSAVAVILCASASLIYAGHRPAAAILLFCAVAFALNFTARRGQLPSARRVARVKLDDLRLAIAQAEKGEGRNYAWVKTVHYRPGFDALIRQNTVLVRDLELQCQALERLEISWPYGKAWRKALSDWEIIAHQAKRSVDSMSDDQFWSTAGQWSSLGYALEPDPPTKKNSRLKLVVDNKDKPPREKPPA